MFSWRASDYSNLRGVERNEGERKGKNSLFSKFKKKKEGKVVSPTQFARPPSFAEGEVQGKKTSSLPSPQPVENNSDRTHVSPSWPDENRAVPPSRSTSRSRDYESVIIYLTRKWIMYACVTIKAAVAAADAVISSSGLLVFRIFYVRCF